MQPTSPDPPTPAIRVVEVGPRDGLQNEAAAIPTDAKVAFVNGLSEAGHREIEVSAFVSPRWVPAMADAAEVFARITRRAGTRYTALVPNLTGLARAIEAGADGVSVFAAASETFSQRNINKSIAASLETYRDVCREASAAGTPVRAYLSTCFGCPFEGRVDPERVVDLTRQLFDLGVTDVALSDTIGVAHPRQVRDLVARVATHVAVERLALHLHDTRGTALVNVYAGLDAGVTAFDASAGGLGGCPYAPGASGNLATEDLLYLLDGLNLSTGIALDRIMAASAALEPLVGHPLPSRVFRASRSRSALS